MGQFSRFGRYETAFKICVGHGLLIGHQVVDEQPNDRLFLKCGVGLSFSIKARQLKSLSFIV
jgi:hypothetical protein